MRHLLARLGALSAVCLLCAACEDSPPRVPVPASVVNSVQVPGYESVRFWGDVDTPAFDAAMTHQYEDLKAAAAAGKLPGVDSNANILAISGGGDKGAFAAGYLKGWSDSGKRPVFGTVTGVSTGALASPFAFLGSSYDDDLKEIYTQNGANQLYEARWDFGLFGNAVKDTKPLKELIEHYADDAFLDALAAQYHLGRRLLVSTTNLDLQRPVIWDMSAIAASGRPDRRELFTNILLASSAVPGVFPPVKIAVVAPDGKKYEELHGDGSVAMQMFFLPPGIKLAQTEGKVFGHTRDRTLYVLRNGKLNPESMVAPEKAIALVQRGVETLVKYQVVYNLRLLQTAAQASQTKFEFMGIPKSFDAPKADKFDVGYAQKLYAAGRDAGLKGEWLTSVPETPELTQ